MYQFPIGVMLESFRLPTEEAVKKAASMGIQGIQMYCTQGEHAPENLTPARRRELLDMVKSCGMTFSAICGDLGHGFGDAEMNPALIEKSKRILDLSKDLEADIVTTHIGVVPSDPGHERYRIMQEACGQLAEYADSIQAHFAVETGPETSATLKGFLDSLGGSRGLGVNLDPANLVMVTGDDPVVAVHNLKDYIVHTHAKDGVMLHRGNPEYIYGVVHPVSQEFQGIQYFAEVPLGQGNVHFDTYLRALDEIGYRGFLTIEREVGEDPAADIRLAVAHLKANMKD
ncbi:MAG: sugar phosphate isomerase/epimerase family protein [Eubacteriales bacterium]